MTLALLFSFQRLAQTFFSLVKCTTVVNTNVLFIDGNIQYYTNLQILVIIYVTLCIIPFPLYLAVAPWLILGNISLSSFFVGCLFPLPLSFYWILRSYFMPSRTKIFKVTDEAKMVCEILQGPYKEYKFPLIPMSLCWSGRIVYKKIMPHYCI